MLISVDPGITGALSFFYDDGRVLVDDMPVRMKRDVSKIKNEIDPVALQRLLRERVPADEKGLVVMESAHAFMGSGKRVGSMASQASLAATKAVVCAICELFGMDVAYVTPRAWKALFGLGSDKAACLALARQLFPEAPLKLSKHHNRAESLLIGRYAQRTLL
jgi:hypothetical protein